ncbi:MAG: fumarylacetoacetate hydrolase family protein [Planctomycetota bacterium]|nr:fumarylacetoacetate hydrolase family protein [Planctomycetota bacterium]
MKRDNVIHVCRFSRRTPADQPRVGVVFEGRRVADLSDVGVSSLTSLLESDDPVMVAKTAAERVSATYPLVDVALLPPVERQEVWAAGVTYLRSKTARMEESDFSATAYDRVYDAPRPEIFFKSVGEKVVGTGDTVGIRRDANWNVPEPELALVMTSRGRLVGCTVGNDMSSRDIEGENLLYLPQAKTYDRSCALGPWITLVDDETLIRQWTISVTITRTGTTLFAGQTGIDQLKRTFGDLMDHLWRSQTFPQGVILLTGTGVVPDESFTLAPHDHITIEISGVGRLENTVAVV